MVKIQLDRYNYDILRSIFKIKKTARLAVRSNVMVMGGFKALQALLVTLCLNVLQAAESLM